MPLTEKDIKRIGVGILLVIMGILAFIIVKPVIFSIVGGLILAYIFFPVYKFANKWIKSRNWAAALVSILALAIIFVPIWFVAPTIIDSVFELFKFSQDFDITILIKKFAPSASEQFIAQASITLNNAASKVVTLILSSVTDFLVDFAVFSLHLLLVAFVFFFALRDERELREFASGLSPLNKFQEKALKNQFKGITQSIVYGQIVVGVVQGILAAIGLFVFGVPNALVLSLVAILLSVIPVIGPFVVYLPAGAYLLLTGSPAVGIGFLLYNFIIVSSVDNILRTHFVSRKTNLSQAVVLVGMVGGLLMFGLMGLILGPLILAYFLTILRAYKENTISSFFSH